MDRIENAQMNSQGTRKLYYEDVHQTDFTAVVMECVPDKEDGYYRIVLDASAFFPEEGGQSADKGTLNGQEVLDVSIKQGILYHKGPVSFPSAPGSPVMWTGTAGLISCSSTPESI